MVVPIEVFLQIVDTLRVSQVLARSIVCCKRLAHRGEGVSQVVEPIEMFAYGWHIEVMSQVLTHIEGMLQTVTSRVCCRRLVHRGYAAHGGAHRG